MKPTQKELFNEISKLKKEFEKKPVTPPSVEKVYTDKTGKLINVKTLSNGTLIINGEVFKVYTPKKQTDLQKQNKSKAEFLKFQNEMLKKYER